MSDDTGNPQHIDMHFHVGQRGDRHPELGHISDRMRGMSPKYEIFLLYAGLKKGEDTDDRMTAETLNVIDGSFVDGVVCLALDHVWDEDGTPHAERSDFWVSNEYVLQLRQERPDKVLFGASVHPFRPDFRERVAECIEQGAVLLKWLPSAQQFSLAHPRAREALQILATAKDGKPLPLLLHVGGEYAVPTTNERTKSYDFLTWGFWDRFWNRFRKPKWDTPDVKGVRETLEAAFAAGAIIIMAHCGLPYFIARWKLLEHDDFREVSRWVRRSAAGELGAGRCYADVSACATPFRKDYFRDIAKLPADHLLFGSDFPTPVFELHADLKEAWKDFRAMLDGHWERIVVPQDNPIDVNHRELSHSFPGHPMFTNFDRYLT